MIKKITDALRASDAWAWELTDTTEKAWEFYFIRHRLDQNRVVGTRHTTVTVYRALEEGFTGSAQMEIPQGSTNEEIRGCIQQLLTEAEFVKNPEFSLHGPDVMEKEDDRDAETGGTGGAGEGKTEADVFQIGKDFIETMNSLPETETEYMNSYEIFVRDITRHYMNSRGVDLTESYPQSTLELVVNARKGDKEIELYRLPSFGTCNGAELKTYVTELFRYGRDRLQAEPTPAMGTADLMLSTEDSCRIYEYFLSQMNAANIYRKFSDWEIGKSIDPEEEMGEKLTIRQVRYLPNSPENHSFDSQGGLEVDRVLLEENVPRRFWGGRQYCSYLGIEDGSIVYNYQVEGGSVSEEELRSGDYLEVVEFSSFDVDPLTGDMAGEIRLGYWHCGDQEKTVTGGSVSGNVRELMAGLSFSGETRQFGTALVPAVTLLRNVTVTGIEDN
ncbi:MAG: TldD/PmbA family protein [Mobilibacterium timonense]|uniref:metallopeptidase TldD-related protein n=1 Tax=Mobilibacterium timonense TaxID=1871012 RepID=UPI002353AFA8|nr:metallopeptidase TldD-related protein [Mobilibacterium timonense]MBM6989872.1 TldD/PmbA family protein [Mobilibacterium timonense]